MLSSTRSATVDDFKPLIYCAACKSEQPLGNFRLLSPDPLLFLDFCQSCEEQFGTLTLYANPNLIAAITPEVRDIILAGDPSAEIAEQKSIDTKDEQRREMARRELMRRRLLYYVTQFRPDYLPGWVHQDICRRLERFVQQVERGESPRLMLFCPPRLGKSTLSSKEFVSWALGHHPNWEIISGSYAVGLPVGFSREIRDRLKSPEYHAVFPNAQIRSDAQNVESWRLTKGGGYLATGVGGGITGFGAHILDLDDVVKDSEAAQSETIRNSTYDWYQTTARTRLAPGGGVLLTMTRWHDLDLAGRLLADQKLAEEAGLPEDQYERWEVISYPALAEYDEYLMPNGHIEQEPDPVPEGARLLRHAGDALHPARYDTSALIRLRNSMPARQWSALYQQNPTPDTGEYFTTDMLRFYTTLPGSFEEYAFFSAWDLAIGERTVNDWTVGMVGAMDSYGSIYVVDMIRGRLNAFGIIEAVTDLPVKWPLLQTVGIENGQIKMTMAPLLKQEMQRKKVQFSMDETLKPVTDKLLRARPLQQKMQMGQVYLPSGQPWSSNVQHELLRFPNGAHDDIVDALAWLTRMSLHITPPKPKKYKNGRPFKSWKKELAASTASSNNYMTA